MQRIACTRRVFQKFLAEQKLCGFRRLHDDSEVPRVKANRRKVPHTIKDYGYRYHYHQPGIDPVPDVKGTVGQDETYTLRCVGYSDVVEKLQKSKEKTWSRERAMFGQNDYIDLLGDGSVHPAQLLYHVPRWLRGFPGWHRANELIRLLHYRNVYGRRMERESPMRQHDFSKRVNYLLKYNNYKKQDEMHDERKLGLWEEKPDWFFKDKLKTRRSFEDAPV